MCLQEENSLFFLLKQSSRPQQTFLLWADQGTLASFCRTILGWPWRRGWALACCKPPPSLRLANAGRLIRLRGDSISPGLRIHSPGLQIHAHTACRVPLPLSPISDEEVDDGGCAGVSRGRLTRGDMANADRSSRPSLPCPPEVWPSQPAWRSEPTRTRPTVFSFTTSPSIAPHFHTP